MRGIPGRGPSIWGASGPAPIVALGLGPVEKSYDQPDSSWHKRGHVIVQVLRFLEEHNLEVMLQVAMTCVRTQGRWAVYTMGHIYLW